MSKRLLGELAAAHAESLIQEWGIRALPIDPFEIAKKHDIVVISKTSDAPGVSGFLMKQGDRFGIIYATHIKSDGFIRFTVGHELGHYFLPGHPEKLFAEGDGVHSSKSGFICDDECEFEADHFAAALLMPEPLFVNAVRESGVGFEAVERLASNCRTSITATAIRYARFAEDPVAVIVSAGNRINYCFMSQPLRDLRNLQWIKKGDALPSRSETHKFNRDEANVREGRHAQAWTSLDLWCDDAPEIELKEDVVGLGSYGRTLTVLFTEDAIEDESDSDKDDDL